MKLIRLVPVLLGLLLPLSAHAAAKVVLGRLARAVEVTKIYAAPNTRSRVFYSVKAQENLVVKNGEKVGWMRVALNNGVYGYVRADKVEDVRDEQGRLLEVTYTPPPRGARRNGGGPVARSSARGAIADYSLNYRGVPYVWGGTDENRGVDCSGFVKKMFGKIGVNLPRTAAQQVHVGKPINRLEDLRKGDRLYFWSSSRNMIGHTGIYLGNGYFVHASGGKKKVATDYLTAKWRSILVAARR